MALPIGFMIFICDLALLASLYLISQYLLVHEGLPFLVVKCMLKIFVKIVKLDSDIIKVRMYPLAWDQWSVMLITYVTNWHGNHFKGLVYNRKE